MREFTYRIRKASELAGLPAARLRAWERRYGVLRPRRAPSGYRAYTAADVALLRELKGLVDEGMAIGDAVRLLPDLRRAARAPADARPMTIDGRLVDGWQARALEAAKRMDQRTVGAVLDEALALLSPLEAYSEVFVPLLREVGNRWHRGEIDVAEEHLVTHEVRARLLALLHRAPRGATEKHVVCACLPDEDHDVGLLGAALRFRHAGYRVTFLGARTPRASLERTVRALKPDLVAVSGVKDPGARTFRAEIRKLVQSLPPGTPLVVGGRAAERHPDIVSLGVRVLSDATAL